MLIKNKVFNQAVIKYIVIILMVLDHYAQYYLNSNSNLYFFCRTISRLTGPTMAFFIAEGYFYTRNVKKYLLRLAIFAIISTIPFTLYETHMLSIFNFTNKINDIPNIVAWQFIPSKNNYFVVSAANVIFSLFFGLLSIVLWDKTNLPVIVKIFFTVLILYLSCFCDWNYYNVLFCLIFYFLRKNTPLMWLAFLSVAVLYIFGIKFTNNFVFKITSQIRTFRLGILAVPLFIELFYNGLPGKKCAFNKWFFYIFYPLHLFVLYYLKMYVI